MSWDPGQCLAMRLETQAKVVATDHDVQAGIAVAVVGMWPVAPVLAGDARMTMLEVRHVPVTMAVRIVIAMLAGMLEGMTTIVALFMTPIKTAVMPVIPVMAIALMAAIVITFMAMTFAIGHGRGGQANPEQRGEGQTHCQFTVFHTTPPVLRPGLSRPWCPR